MPPPQFLNPSFTLPPIQAPPPALYFVVYAYVPPKLGPPPLYVLGSGAWEQMTGLMSGQTALCQFFWDADKTRTYRVLYSLGQGSPLKVLGGGDRPGWKWFLDLGCYQVAPWAGIDWNALSKGPH